MEGREPLETSEAQRSVWIQSQWAWLTTTMSRSTRSSPGQSHRSSPCPGQDRSRRA